LQLEWVDMPSIHLRHPAVEGGLPTGQSGLNAGTHYSPKT
jgi:hypothetical protein